MHRKAWIRAIGKMWIVGRAVVLLEAAGVVAQETPRRQEAGE